MGKPTEDVYRLCPCGSGKKYKFCCLQDDRERRRQLLGEARRAIEPGGEPLLVFDLEEAERAHELGLDVVQRGMGREAIPILERSIAEAPLVPQPYNNLAMAHYLVGDLEKALAICEKVDRLVDSGNVFALGNRIHFLLVLGRRREAEEAGRRISNLAGRDEFAVYKKCEALARLGRHDEVHDTATRGLPRARECSQSVAFYAGTAAANLARYEEAERYLSAATDDPVHGQTARRHVRAAGWVCAYDEFSRMYGAEEHGDGAPAPLALLRTSGLVAEGTVGGLSSVVIPREVRPALDQTLSSSSPG